MNQGEVAVAEKGIAAVAAEVVAVGVVGIGG